MPVLVCAEHMDRPKKDVNMRERADGVGLAVLRGIRPSHQWIGSEVRKLSQAYSLGRQRQLIGDSAAIGCAENPSPRPSAA